VLYKHVNSAVPQAAEDRNYFCQKVRRAESKDLNLILAALSLVEWAERVYHKKAPFLVILPATHELGPCHRVPHELSANSLIISAG